MAEADTAAGATEEEEAMAAEVEATAAIMDGVEVEDMMTVGAVATTATTTAGAATTTTTAGVAATAIGAVATAAMTTAIAAATTTIVDVIGHAPGTATTATTTGAIGAEVPRRAERTIGAAGGRSKPERRSTGLLVLAPVC